MLFILGVCRLPEQAAENDAAHGFDKLTMRSKPLKLLGLILSLSKDEA